MSKTVSVIVPAYNCENQVERAIRSIVDQTHTNLEILIADDGSTDGTREAIDSFTDNRIVRFHNSKNLGYLRTVNRLLAQAKGEYICFQDADDWSATNRIELQVHALQSMSVDACGTGIYYTSAAEKPLKRMVYPAQRETVRQYMLNGLPAACYASILFSREVMNSIGGYRDFFDHGAEDVDWLLRLTEQHTYTNLDQALYFYRFSASSITQTIDALKLKASLVIARELAAQRAGNPRDDIDTGNAAKQTARWNKIYEQLRLKPGAEELHKINMLLRRNARWESIGVCIRMLSTKAPLSSKLVVIASTIVKILLGFERYERIGARMRGRPNELA
ncbi:MAG: glycosyltransferase involved in cell wall biosynthesis [Halioglobus sp.]